MSKGILQVAFGKSYDNLAAHCVAYSRRYTDLPITVLTNLTDKERSKTWRQVSGVDFVYIDGSVDANRGVKTLVNLYTPYDDTIYMDCDAIVQRRGLDGVFDKIVDDCMVLSLYSRWGVDKPLTSTYANAFKKFRILLPVNIYYGAFFAFRKSEATHKFFKTWNALWLKSGAGRDMPALACAVRKTKIDVVELNNADKIFTWLVNKEFIIQHEYKRYVSHLVGCADFQPYKPFDKPGWRK